MKKINKRLRGVLAVLFLVFGLTACTGNETRAATYYPNEVSKTQELMQFLTESKVEEAAALFAEGATIVKENPAFDYVDQVTGYAYRHLVYGQVYSIDGHKDIKSYLQNLVNSDFKASTSKYEYNGVNLSWHNQVLLGHTAIQADFTAEIENAQISRLTITYTDLVNLPTLE